MRHVAVRRGVARRAEDSARDALARGGDRRDHRRAVAGPVFDREYKELARELASRGKATARATPYFFLTMPMDWTGALSAMQFVRLLYTLLPGVTVAQFWKVLPLPRM